MDSKMWYKSSGIIGGLIALIMFVVQMLGLDLDEGMVTELITLVFQLVGILVAIYGRITAKAEIAVGVFKK